jgi:hypothetical protein
MPEMNGIEATRRIVAAHPDVVVFLCSTHDVTDLPPGAPTSGARAYINKEHFGADALRQLWHNRDSTPFARLLASATPRPAFPPRVPAPRPQPPHKASAAPRYWESSGFWESFVHHSPQTLLEAPTLPVIRNRTAGACQEARGIEPLMVEPWPGRESQRTVPPMAPSRSAMLT